MVLLALSLQDQVEKYGSYVGIAAFFGLAILSLLYFAQAREVKRLREWAGRAPERAREVEEAALAAADAARRRPAPAEVQQQAPAQPVAATVAGGRSGTVTPAVPVGAATAVAERPEDEEPPEEDAEPPVVEGPGTKDGKRPVAALPPEAEAKAVAEDEESDEPEAAERDDDDERDEAEDADTDQDGDEDADERPAAVAAPTNGAPPAGAQPPVFPRPSTAAGVASAGGAPAPVSTPAPAAAAPAAQPATPAAKRPAPAMPVRAAAPSASPRSTVPPRRPLPPAAPASSGRGGRRWAVAGGVAAVIAALGIYAATQLLGGDDTPTAPNRTEAPTAAPTESASSSGDGGASGTSRADTTVAVFNGTTVNGLASQTGDKLAGSGYKRGSTGDYTDQQRAASTVFYRRAARTQARNIGRELNISDLRLMDAETQALAGEGADVAVVVGSDKAP